MRALRAGWLGVLMTAAVASATIIEWGNTAADWATGGNWVGGTAPANDITTDIASFEALSVTANPTIGANRSVAGIRFVAGTAAWTISTSGGNRTLTIGSSGIVNSSSNTQTFQDGGGNLTVRLGADASFVGNSGALAFNSNISVSNNGFRLTLDGASTADSIAAAITGNGGLTKIGSGTWTLSGGNSYSGTTEIGTSGGTDGGTLRLGADNVLPSTTLNLYGGTLDINSRVDTVGAINLGGGDATSTATITGTTGTLTLGGNITYSGTNGENGAVVAANLALSGSRVITVGDSANAAVDLTIGSGDFSDSINIGGNTLTIGGAGNTLINSTVGVAGNSGSFIKNGSGTVTFYGDRNFYTGTTTVNDGTLVLDTLNSFSDETIRGALVIGDNTGAAGSARVLYGSGAAHNKINNSSAITINADGVLDLNSKDDTVGAITLTGGQITTGIGVLTMNGNIATNASGQTALIDGVLSLGNATRTFTVANGAAASDLTVNAQINFGSIVKAGAGTMTITSDNTIGYGGTTAVNAGVLNIQHGAALGQTGASDPAKGTTVANLAALELENNISVGDEMLTLSGTGVSNGGALRNVSGTNSWDGAVLLNAATRINSDAGTLTMNGAITGTNRNLTVGGSGDTTINGAIGTGSGTLTKDGTGTLTLTGNSTYTGTTSVTAGVVNIQHNSALGSTVAGTTVSNNAALQLQNNITVGAETLSLTGTGVGGTGALRNISGSNTWGGTTTIAAAGTRINSDGGTLTMGGTVAMGTNAASFGGAGNVTISGQLTGSGTLTKDGAGTLTLSNSTNTFSGDVAVSAGTLAMGANNALNSTAIDMSVATGATVSLVQYAQSLGTLAGTGLIDFGSGGKLTLASSSTFSGAFSGTGELVVGAGVILTLGADFTANNLTITLAGGTLNLAGNNHSFGTLNITGTSFVDFAAGTDSNLNIGTLSFGSLLNTLTVNGWNDGVDFFTTPNNPGAQGVPPLNQVIFNGFSGNQTAWLPYDHQITPVPEPSTYGACLFGSLLAFFSYRRWRGRRAQR